MPLIGTKAAASAQGFGFTLGGAEPVYIEQIFSTFLYTGNNSTQTINNGIDLAGKGGLVWIKCRNDTPWHQLTDSVRGITKKLHSNSDLAQGNQTDFSSFNANGFTLNTTSGNYNENGLTYVSWTFREQPKFFDVVTYTGTGSIRTIAHSLGSTPGCIIVKRTDTTGDWYVYHNGFPSASYYALLNTTGGIAVSTAIWGNTAPTSSVFSVGTGATNTSGGTYVAYLFAHNAGGFGLTGTDNVISCGSYTASGTSTTITLGYEPQWLLIKKTNVSGDNWRLLDTMRGMPVPESTKFTLAPNLSAAEESWSNAASPTATGFIVNGAGLNDGGDSYIYIAIRRGPMKTPTSGTSVYQGITRSGTGATATVSNVGFPSDLVLIKARNSGGLEPSAMDRLRGAQQTLFTPLTDGEYTLSSVTGFDSNVGYTLGTLQGTNGTGFNFINWNFRRAPGFFDEVCYTGTGVARTVPHNLGVVPELMIVKKRNGADNWFVYSATLGNNANLALSNNSAVNNGTTLWNTTTPTASVFSLGTSPAANESGFTFVMYLFASCPGVSKVGSYTGTGSTQVINCGFTGGARFVLIKASSTTGNWMVWDSARGIVAGNDPYLILNSTSDEITNTDWVDTAASGFELSNAGGNLANSNGVSYIFLAIS